MLGWFRSSFQPITAIYRYFSSNYKLIWITAYYFTLLDYYSGCSAGCYLYTGSAMRTVPAGRTGSFNSSPAFLNFLELLSSSLWKLSDQKLVYSYVLHNLCFTTTSLLLHHYYILTTWNSQRPQSIPEFWNLLVTQIAVFRYFCSVSWKVLTFMLLYWFQ